MHHQQYRESSLLLRLREWKLSNPEGTLAHARSDLRKTLTEDDTNLLFDNWLNANFDRIELKEASPGAVVAVYVRGRGYDPDKRRQTDVMAHRIATKVKSNLFDDFAARIWDTLLPNGVVLRDATGKDMKHATGWFAELGKRLKPTEKVVKKFSTKQLFDLSQREVFAGAA